MFEKIFGISGKTHYNKGIEFYNLGKYDSAIDEMHEATITNELDKDERFNAFIITGDCFLKLDDYVTAIKNLNNASKFRRKNESKRTKFWQNWLLEIVDEEISEYSQTINYCDNAINEYYTDPAINDDADDIVNAYAKLRKGLANIWLKNSEEAIKNLYDAIELVQNSDDETSDFSNQNLLIAVALLHIGIAHEMQLHHEEAIRLMKRAIELVPKSDPIPYMPHPNTFHPYARYYLGLAYWLVDREKSSQYFEIGRLYLDKAIELTLKSKSPVYYQLSRQKGWTHIFLNEYDNAELTLNNALKHSINADDSSETEEKNIINEILVKLPYLKDELDASEHKSNDEYNKAIKIYDRILVKLDSNPELLNLFFKKYRLSILREKGKCLRSLEEYEDAIEIYDGILNELDSNLELLNRFGKDKHTEIIWEKGKYLSDLGEYEDAIEIYDGILDELDSNIELLNRLGKDKRLNILRDKGDCLLLLDKYEDAIEIYDGILDELDSNPESLNSFGKDKRLIILRDKGDCLRYLEEYEDAIEIYDGILNELKSNLELLNGFGIDNSVWILKDIGDCLRYLEEYEGAIELYDIVLNQIDSNTELLNGFGKKKYLLILNKADCLRCLEKYEDAIGLYDMILNQIDSNPELLGGFDKDKISLILRSKDICLSHLNKDDDSIEASKESINYYAGEYEEEIEELEFCFCPYCGTKLNSDFLFCPKCGKKLKEN